MIYNHIQKIIWTNSSKSYLPWYLCSQAMESKLLMGGKNIVDHTNEQQRALEHRRQEIAERKVCVFFILMSSMIKASSK